MFLRNLNLPGNLLMQLIVENLGSVGCTISFQVHATRTLSINQFYEGIAGLGWTWTGVAFSLLAVSRNGGPVNPI